ncbi:MAG: VWA domain-containing protein [Bacteroidetes bacterium]|nr:VWA domain-containing protein [Bacteroidota bacterium]MBS1973010.1 VWA domain-containing protein [Bacteroidota bacterium]
MSLAYPAFLGLLLIVPFMIFWYRNKYNKGQSSVIISTTQNFRGAASWKSTFRHIPFILRMLAAISLVIALARPQIKNEERLINGEGIDIILCIDISGSMLAQDFTPNRIEAAKNVASTFIDNRPTDRIGLVIFSGESFTMCPLTADHNVLQTQLYNVQSGLLEDGTAIGSGLATSVDRLRQSPSKSKVIILLTDGENNGGLIDPNTAKEIAKSVGVRVYTIGVGTEGYAPVPVQTSGGVIMQREKINIDEKLLTQIANETGGKYYRATDDHSLKSIYSEIDKLEKSKVEVAIYRRYSEQFLPFALAAATFLLFELVLKFTLFRKFP